MRTFNKIIIFICIIFVGLFACDKIEDPFIEYNEKCGDASLPVPIKQILIEEFTGHQCGYCPEGARTIDLLKELYCDHIIPVAIHAGYFADVKEYGNEYMYEYRTYDGDMIDTYFEASSSGVPNGMINRKEFNGDVTLNPANWAIEVVDLLFIDIVEMISVEPVMDIKINTSYILETRELEIDVDVIFIESMNTELMLSVYYVEDSIVSWQKDYSLPNAEQDVEFYSHNHVLRDAVNGTWGDQVLSGQVNVGEVKSKSYSYVIDEEWVVENSSIVAFVYRSDTKEVLQARQEKL